MAEVPAQFRSEADFQALRDHLEYLYRKGDLPLYRGRIARTPLQQMIGFPANALLASNKSPVWGWARQCVEGFDDWLRKEEGRGTVWENKVPQIRRRLEELAAKGNLPVNGKGRLNRTAVLREFGHGNQSASVAQQRAPFLLDLLDEFDRKVTDGGYSQYKFEHLVPHVERLLAGPDVELAHGRIVSYKWLAKKLATNIHSLKQTPAIVALVERKEKEIDRDNRRGKTTSNFQIGGVSHINLGATPYSEVHKRVFSFRELDELYGLEFAEKVGTTFTVVVNEMRSAKAYYYRLLGFLKWLAANEGDADRVFGKFRSGLMPTVAEFERAVLTYQQVVRAELDKQAGKTGNQRPKANFAVIERMGEVRLFPKVTLVGNKRKRKPRGERSSRPSMAEAQRIDSDKILTLTTDAANYRGIEFSINRDARLFAASLAWERSERSDLPDSLPEAIAVLCADRLEQLRIAATNVYREWYAAYRERALITGNPRRGLEIASSLKDAKASGSPRIWSDTVAAFFPKKDSGTALQNLLVLIDHEFAGVCPVPSTHDWGQFWNKQYMKVGGVEFVQKHLRPPRLVVSAAILLYLCESGANVSVALSLAKNALRPARIPKHLNVVGIKERAGGKPIYNDLPKESESEDIEAAVKALRAVADIRSGYSPHESANSKLLSYAARGEEKYLTEWQLREDIIRIATESETLKALRLYPSMIRTTVLLHAQLRNPGNLGVAMLIGQHESESTTFGYTNKLPYRLILEERIRQFTNTVEIVVSRKLVGGSAALSITDEDARLRMENAKRTGLGVVCSDPLSGEQPDYPKGKSCGALDRCLSCKKLIVVAEPESIADMILWRDALLEACANWVENRLERWETVWVPWQALFQVVLDEKMTRGELAAIKADAHKIADRRRSARGFVGPSPW